MSKESASAPSPHWSVCIGIPSIATCRPRSYQKSDGLNVAASEGPYKDYLHQRWSEGARNVTHLVAELRKQGYHGSETIVFD